MTSNKREFEEKRRHALKLVYNKLRKNRKRRPLCPSWDSENGFIRFFAEMKYGWKPGAVLFLDVGEEPLSKANCLWKTTEELVTIIKEQK